MTDRSSRQRALLGLALAILVMSPLVAVAWVVLSPLEALILPPATVFFFCRKWVEVWVVVRWKEGNDEGNQKSSCSSAIGYGYRCL